ncbi:MAG: 4-hydroxy-tetrahydrodipicolinate reductase [Candidatus Levybacteria bacterium]|nr:4-hydroxy-tetrahydrodipicolinate reductase [Candidatus Levybacteria bacterium]
MKIALVGFGKMGRELEDVIVQSGVHQIISISYKNRNDKIDIDGLKESDVVIDFTSPEIIFSTIKTVIGLGKPMVVGTTGWYDKMPQVERIVKKNKGSLIYGQNFSIGANIFFSIISFASALIGKYEDYDVFGIETHHSGKKDSPSGTARKLAEIIIKNYPKKTTLQVEKLDRQIRAEELHFASIRGGRNFGMHEIVFDSPADEIRLSHQAWGRKGFALGAINAAEFIKGKKGFYNFNEIFANQNRKGGDK